MLARLLRDRRLPLDQGRFPDRRLAGRLLLAGFGGLLLLMLVAGIDALLVLRQVRSSDTQERDLYLRRATALDRVRTGIYQAALVTRAYLLATDAHEAAFQLDIWKQTHNRGALSIYSGSGAEAKELLAGLDAGRPLD